MNPKDIKSTDEHGQSHGYIEKHYANGRLWYKGAYDHGHVCGYYVEYCRYGKIDNNYTGYYVKGKRAFDKISVDNPEGVCIIWNKREL
jgi:antitoxin component YwqK of YwqJK toxin-antitoxin module